MIDTLHFDFGEARIFKNFVVAMMKEGITVEPAFNINLDQIAKKYYAGRKFGYITYRENSYSVNPLVYIETSKIDNLVAFAVVATTGIKEDNIKIEKLFLKKPIQAFYDLDKAKAWILKMIEISENT